MLEDLVGTFAASVPVRFPSRRNLSLLDVPVLIEHHMTRRLCVSVGDFLIDITVQVVVSGTVDQFPIECFVVKRHDPAVVPVKLDDIAVVAHDSALTQPAGVVVQRQLIA